MWTPRRRRDTNCVLSKLRIPEDGLFEHDSRKQRTRKQRSQSLDIDVQRYSWRELFRNSKRGNKDQKQRVKSMSGTEDLPDWPLSGLNSLPEDRDLHTINELRNALNGSDSIDRIPTKNAQFFVEDKTDVEFDGITHVEVDKSLEEFTPTEESRQSRPQSRKPKKTRSSSFLAYVANLRISRQRRFRYKKSRSFSVDDEELLERCLSNKET